MELDNNGNNKALVDVITCHITASLDSQITFAEFMDLALYHPQHGYYATNPTRIGATGDYFTSPHLASDFGELLAEQFYQIWHLLQQPDRFTLVEMGAGQGLLARDVLHYLLRHYPDLIRSLDYQIVERAPVLLAEQKRQLQSFLDQGISLSWCALDQIPPDSVTGCFFSNELVDALPVHQVTIQQGQLQEVYVGLGMDDRSDYPFQEIIDRPSTPRLNNYFAQIGINLTAAPYAEGYRTEVDLAALDWISQVASRLQRGYILTIDYGYPADRYYHPLRATGTLQCYYRHRYHNNPFAYIGQQDITAHVNFTALEKQGERCGLQTVGFTKQALFLMSLGLGDRLAAIAQTQTTDLASMNNVLRRRTALQTLIDPVGLGNFGVLIQSKGVEQNSMLNGLRGEQN